MPYRDCGQSQVVESQCGPLGFWSEAMTFGGVENKVPFEKQLLAYSWALQQTECPSMGQQVTVQRKPPTMT